MRRPPRLSQAALGTTLGVLLTACGTTAPLTAAGSPVQQDQTDSTATTTTPTGPADVTGQLASGTTGASTRSGSVPGGFASGRGITSSPTASLADGTSQPQGTSPSNTSRATRASGRLSIGFVAAGNAQDGASQAGANSGNTVSLEAVFDALVKYYNARGGLGGRQIAIVKYIIPVTETNYDQALAAACQNVTRDHKVDVLVSALGFYSRSFISCIAKAKVPHVEVGAAPTDSTDLAMYPTYVSVSDPEVTTRFDSVFRGAREAGLLPSGTKVGVVLEDCDYQIRAYNRTIAKLVTTYNLKLSLFHASCVGGYGDAGSLAASMQNAVLRFRSDGVTRVFFGSTGEAVFHLLFDKVADSQGYSPTYLASSLMQAAAGTTANFSAARLKLIHGWGYSPDNDVAARHTDAPALTCLKAVRATGLTPSSKTDDWYVSLVCAGLGLIDTVLTKTRGHVDVTSFIDGLDSLGTTWKSPSTTGNVTRFARGRHSGPSTWREFSFNDGCSCFTYGRGQGTFT